MRKRVLRVTVALVLLASAGAAAVTLRDLSRRAAQGDALGSRVDELYATIAELGVAQAGYLTPGQDPGPWLERFPVLLREATAATARLAPDLRSAEAERALQTFADNTATLSQADALVRDSLLAGDTLGAAHIIFGESRAALTSMEMALAGLRAGETAALDADRAEAVRRAQLLLSGVALVWLLGVALLVPLPRERRHKADADVAPHALQSPSVDLEGVAALCGEIARVQATPELQALLEKLLVPLQASGLVLWLRADRDLLPVVVLGYEPGTAPPPSRIPCDDEHLAARAFQAAEVRAATTEPGTGSWVAAPLVAPGGSSGVLALEFGTDRTNDPVTRAAAAIVAAQLSTVVAGWPSRDAVRATG